MFSTMELRRAQRVLEGVLNGNRYGQDGYDLNRFAVDEIWKALEALDRAIQKQEGMV